jgi:hypothetical protein
MEDDDVDTIYNVLEETFKGKRVGTIELILSSLGGMANAAFNIVRTIRSYADTFNVIIPRRAKSAASLIALGADKIFMHRMSELGPIDPIVSHPMGPILIPARAAPYFIEKVLPEISKMENTVSNYFLKVDYAHVGFCITTVEKAREYAKRLLLNYHFKDRSDKQKIADDVARQLTSYPSHDFIIGSDEAKNILHLNVEELNEEDWKIVWSLYNAYKKKLNVIGFIVETTKARYERPAEPSLKLW